MNPRNLCGRNTLRFLTASFYLVFSITLLLFDCSVKEFHVTLFRREMNQRNTSGGITLRFPTAVFLGMVQIRCCNRMVRPTLPPLCATFGEKVAQRSITLTHDSATTCIASATAAPLFSRRGASGARLRWHDRHTPLFHNAHDVTRFGPELNQADF